MTDYTPTTEQVRYAYATRMAPVRDGERYAEFDRWLRAAKAAAWAEGYERGYDDGDDKRDYDPTQHPYRTQED